MSYISTFVEMPKYLVGKKALPSCAALKIFRYLSKYKTTRKMNIIFKALNDPIRREILEILKQGDMTAGDIAEKFDVGKPTISHHLDLLRQANLVTSIKDGQFVLYTLNTTVLDEILKWMINLKGD